MAAICYYFGFAELPERENIRYAECPRSGAGLVKDNRLDILRPFKCLPFPDEQAGFGCEGGRYRNNKRYSEPERMGACDDHHGRRPLDCKPQLLPEQEPPGKGDGTDTERNDDKLEGGPVGEILCPGFALLCLADKGDDLVQVRLLPGPVHFRNNRTLPR